MKISPEALRLRIYQDPEVIAIRRKRMEAARLVRENPSFENKRLWIDLEHEERELCLQVEARILASL